MGKRKRISWSLYNLLYKGHSSMIEGSYNTIEKTIEVEITTEQQNYIDSLQRVTVDCDFANEKGLHADYINYREGSVFVDVIVEPDKVAKVKEANRKFVEKKRQEEQAERARRWARVKYNYFFFNTSDIVTMTRKAILIRMNEKTNFWFPKCYVTEKESYYQGHIPYYFSLNDEHHIPLDKYAVWEALGDRNRAAQSGDAVDLYEKNHVPPKIKPKKVEIDDRLKR